MDRLTRAFGDGEGSPSSASSHTLTPTRGSAGPGSRGRIWTPTPTSSGSDNTAIDGPQDEDRFIEDRRYGDGSEGEDLREVQSDSGIDFDEEGILDLESALSSARSSMVMVSPGWWDDGKDPNGASDPPLDVLVRLKLMKRSSWRHSNIFGSHCSRNLSVDWGATTHNSEHESRCEADAHDLMDVVSAVRLLEEVDVWLMDMRTSLKQLEQRHVQRGIVGS